MNTATTSSLRDRWIALSLSVLALAAAMFMPTQAQAQWAWRDANGRITASDLPPPREVADKDIVTRPKSDKRRADAAAAPSPAAAPAASAASPATLNRSAGAEPTKTDLEREVEARKTKAEQEQAAKKKAEESKLAAQRAENCQRARLQLASLDSGMRLARVNANGEREVLDDNARAAETRKAREVMAADCR